MFQPLDKMTFYQVGLGTNDRVVISIYDVNGGRIECFEPANREEGLSFFRTVLDQLFERAEHHQRLESSR